MASGLECPRILHRRRKFRAQLAGGVEWEVENIGVAPDIEVELDPALVRKGHDPQLEKAVEVVMEELKKNPPPKLRRPPFPNYYRPAAH